MFRSLVPMLVIVALYLNGAPTVQARKRFRRVYRRSRTVTIRHQGRVKKVPTNAYYAAYDERTYRLLPNWRAGRRENTRGIINRWQVTDKNEELQLTPHHRRVSPRRPAPNEVKALRIEDRLDNFHGRR